MSQPPTRTIKINPELFTLKPRNIKNKTLKKSVNTTLKPGKLKGELLKKIQNYRYKQQNNPTIETETKTKTDTETETHVEIINKNQYRPAIKLRASRLVDNTDNDDDFSQSINFLKELSSKKKHKIPTENFPLALEENTNNISKTSLSDSPPYSCLKNSSLPTYREWKNKTLKKPTDPANNVEININSDKFDYPTQMNENSKTKTLKYYLGKKGKKVAILVKNSETRKKITQEHNILKQTSLVDMKRYLKRHNLLKSGSRAPDAVIKKMYEQSLLGGDIRNSNKTNLIHNYLAE